jgi:hypothetical protein
MQMVVHRVIMPQTTGWVKWGFLAQKKMGFLALENPYQSCNRS